MTDWYDDYDREISYAETDDPRVLAVIQRQVDNDCEPDGDGYAPAYWLEHHRGDNSLDQAGSTGMMGDPDAQDVANAYAVARSYFRDHDKAMRYLRIFYDVYGAEIVSSTVHRDYSVIIFDLPSHRKHVGCPDSYPSEDFLAGDKMVWQSYLDGEVYGFGKAVNLNRVSHEADIDLSQFEVEIDCWGFYGGEYAQEEALASLVALDQGLLDI